MFFGNAREQRTSVFPVDLFPSPKGFFDMDPIIVYLALIFAGPVPSPSPAKVPIGVHSKTF